MSERGIRPGIRRLFRLPMTGRARRSAEVDDEIRLHLELRTAEFVRKGMPPDAARHEALRQFGSVNDAREILVYTATMTEGSMQREERLGAWVQDVGFAMRQLRRSPSFALAVILTLALGIGANATMFGIVDRLLLEPPPGVVDPAHIGLATVTTDFHGHVNRQTVLSYPIYEDLRDTPNTFTNVAAYSSATLAFGDGERAQQIRGMRVTASYFATLGVPPEIGRFFTAEEADVDPGPPLMVLGYDFWQGQFGGRKDVLGTRVSIGGRNFTILGVAPRGFAGVELGNIDAFVPLSSVMGASQLRMYRHARQAYWLSVVGRVAPGESFDQAQSRTDATLLASEAKNQGSDADARRTNPRLVLTSALPREGRRDRPEAKVALLLSAVALLVLIVSCANVANLQLARAVRRRREVAIRVALGVSRGRLARSLFADAFVLATLGGLGALVVVEWGGAIIRRMLFGSIAIGGHAVDGRVLAFTALAVGVTALATSAAPIMHSLTTAISASLKSGAREGAGYGGRLRATLLVTQAALTVVMLAGTGLFVLSLRRIDAVPLGMDPDHVVVVTAMAAGRGYTPAQTSNLYSRIAQHARELPGVEHAALTTSLPFRTSMALNVMIPGLDSVPLTSEGGPYVNIVDPDYFASLGTKVVAGRGFNANDHEGSAPVAVLNATAAKLWWPKGDAIGHCLRVDTVTAPCATVVGVVEDSRRQSVIEDAAVAIFLPSGQGPTAPQSTVMVRTRDDARAVATAVQRGLQRSEQNLPYISAQPLSDIIAPQLKTWRVGATMFGAFGVLALVLAALGLYASLAYDVVQRTTEMGIRIALGAQARDVASTVVGRGAKVVIGGAVIGLMIALGAGSIVSPLLFDTSPREPIVFAFVAAVMAVVTVAATVVPAIRAANVDPRVSLQSD